jgi:hypothetical protein
MKRNSGRIYNTRRVLLVPVASSGKRALLRSNVPFPYRRSLKKQKRYLPALVPSCRAGTLHRMKSDVSHNLSYHILPERHNKRNRRAVVSAGLAHLKGECYTCLNSG